ncbi:metallophosphoesterase [Variovorax sp. J22P240]|uniref:metallophosphoesterase n=1 Tax=Variovorax sp. J22P240 TaxID=3053514 RepID=UPI0025778195|nr:metallophosphoesterase [Variovorax sp. J22P240]MDM0001829.1 metallophosphoesterase [Variovorax sp. J22P240]
MSLGDMARYDVVHVISDLHMGGKQGFQILRETTRLGNYVRRLASHSPDANVALVLNGDVFDTLAEDTGGYVAIEQAATTVGRIMDDPSFKEIWDALAAFVQTSRRHLIVVIGNHDIEIAFPPVQRLVIERLAGDDPAARGRIEFSIMGAGYTCMVGSSRVYCVHGNEVDPWNYNRYEDLARVARRLNAGQTFDPTEWRPNAGTKMVKEVMNNVKRRYAWIDLLKPETSAALGTLMAIDPSQVKKLGELVGIIGEKRTGTAEFAGRLSAEGFAEPAGVPPAEALEKLLGANLRNASAAQPAATDMLLASEASLDGSAHAASPEGTLGTGQLIVDRLTGWLRNIEPDEALRRALLDWLRGDTTFAFDNRDETCTEVMKSVGPAVDIVITGHTHLARAIDLGGGRLYFNSGTWIRLMQFTEAMLKDSTTFRPIYAMLNDGKMATIDAATFAGRPLLLDRTSEIEVALDADEGVSGRLNWILGDGKGAPATEIQLQGRR